MSRLTSTARNHKVAGKGDRDRTVDHQAYRDGYNRIEWSDKSASYSTLKKDKQ